MGLSKKGFVIIVVVALLAVLMLIAWVIVNVGLGEILQARIQNDLTSAFYVASAGAELRYAILKASGVVAWGQTINGTLSLIGQTIGTYSVTADRIDGTSTDEFCIVSRGTVKGRQATVTVKYGFDATFYGYAPLGSIGDITLDGASNPAKLKIDGPVVSNGFISSIGSVEVASGTYQNSAILNPINFWETPDPSDPSNLRDTRFDTNDDGNVVGDYDGNGEITWQDAVELGQEDIFTADNVYGPADGAIDEDDAFYYYYTTYLNDAANNPLGVNLNIAPGGTYHYVSNQSFDQGDIANSVPIIFIDGNVAIDQNDQNWQGSGVLNHTVVVMGDVSLYQPTNRPGDILTIIAWGDVALDGEMGNQGGTIGDIFIYTHGDFTATNGGKLNASIFAEGTISIDTIGDDAGKDHMMMSATTIDPADPSAQPLGLPPGYPDSISAGFTIDNESTYKSIWQRT